MKKEDDHVLEAQGNTRSDGFSEAFSAKKTKNCACVVTACQEIKRNFLTMSHKGIEFVLFLELYPFLLLKWEISDYNSKEPCMPLITRIDTPFKRFFPATRIKNNYTWSIESALNEQAAFQVVLRNETKEQVCTVLDIIPPKGFRIRIRRVGYVPVPHHNTPLAESRLD
jgi:hypothetical protein